ncbi:MAG: DUF4136 domain-containing protein [Bacteroidaceae bacterium]|nr:DUF4136 domain-containing protein [Bacteroidaceae bacterium]
MKKFSIYFSVVASVILAACQKDPDIERLDNDYIVYTNYDSGTDFQSINTFHIIDSILIIGNDEKATYWNNANSENIIATYSSELKAAGYTPVASIDSADVILQLSYVNTTYYFNIYSGGPWWNYYPGYWNWGGWGWYYPYSFTYNYSTGSIIGELVNTNAPTIEKDKLTVVWNSYICGLLNGNSLSLSRTTNAIKQAFVQSPYLFKK